jgi:HlyD family secretion protein
MAEQLTLSPSEYRYSAPDKAALSEWEDVLKEEQHSQVSLLGPILLGLSILVLGIGGFMAWASSTEMSSASVASGRVIVESNTKTVSHLEGGTLKQLLVREGDRVKAGALLATLDATRSQSSLTQLRHLFFAAKARQARLVAERDGQKSYDFDAPTPDGVDASVAAGVLATEKRLFTERTSLYRDQIAADESSIAQLASQRVANEARRKSNIEQAAVVRRDYETYVDLQKRKLITTAMLNDKKLQLVELETRIAESEAALAENSQRKTQLELSLTNRRNEYFRDVSENLQQTQAEISSVRQQIIAAEDVVEKAALRAPQDGIVGNIRVRTPGSAVIAGQPVLDIVPANQPMVIEGHARAIDIDQIRLGQAAEIRLSSFGAAELQPLIGHVTYIAPDSNVNEQTGEVTFAFRAKIDDGELKKQPNLFLYPGMSAEVYIVTGDRTALAYLAEPIKKSFYRAFREQ